MSKKGIKVLVVDGGGRGHALFEKIFQSPLVSNVLCTPGNAGIPTQYRRDIKVEDLNGLQALARHEKPDLIVFGPEFPLVYGHQDLLAQMGFKVFGPSWHAARLEGSKIYCARICHKYKIPMAKSIGAHSYSAAQKIIREWNSTPIIVKADGLCGGKGVKECATKKEALAYCRDLMLGGIFNEAGHSVLFQKKLYGEECSYTILADGDNILLLPPARDHKRRYAGPPGPHNPNTGGMGAYSPVPDVTGALNREIARKIAFPLVKAMRAEGHPYRGAMCLGVMLTKKGPLLYEVNARFNDPEAQVILARMQSDIVLYLLACTDGTLNTCPSPKWSQRAAVCLVVVKKTYPSAQHYTESWVEGVEDAMDTGALIYHAGTKFNSVGKLVATDGRVLNAVGRGRTLSQARLQANHAVLKVLTTNELDYRPDIAAGL